MWFLRRAINSVIEVANMFDLYLKIGSLFFNNFGIKTLWKII